MSASKTPDDKMYRYLQRIQKLVGQRSKSPSLMKSRNLSPLSIKTSKINDYIKHQRLFKSLFYLCEQHNLKYKYDFLQNFIQISGKFYKKNQNNFSGPNNEHFQMENPLKFVKKQNDKPLATRFIAKSVQNIVKNSLVLPFQIIKSYQPASNLFQQTTRFQQKTYSSIFSESLLKQKHKLPSSLRFNEYMTPEVLKKQTFNYFNGRTAESKLILSILQRILVKVSQSVFSQLRGISQRQIRCDLISKQKILSSIQRQFSALEDERSQQQIKLKRALQILAQLERNGEKKTIQEMQEKCLLQERRENSLNILKDKSKEQNNSTLRQLEVQLRQLKFFFSVYRLLDKKAISFKASCFNRFKLFPLKIRLQQHMCFSFSNIISKFVNKKTKFFFDYCQQATHYLKHGQKNLKPSAPFEIREQSLCPSHPLINNLKSWMSNLDFIQNKINKAFELKYSLNDIYSHAFQKIDKASLISLTLSRFFCLITNCPLKESFGKILSYSFYQSQRGNKKERSIYGTFCLQDIQKFYKPKSFPSNGLMFDEFNQSKQSIIQVRQTRQKKEKMSLVMQKVYKKELFMKIQAYSLIKLASQLKKINYLPKVAISEIELKKQIKEFLLQRNKMHKKTSDTWHKTKQMLENSKSQNFKHQFINCHPQ